MHVATSSVRLLQRSIFHFVLIRSCSGQPLHKRSIVIEKRGTPLAQNPFAAVVFTIAVILCLTIIVWAMRKHYQQKFTAEVQISDDLDKEIPEQLRPGPPIHCMHTMHREDAEESDSTPVPPPARTIPRREVQSTNPRFNESGQDLYRSPSTYIAYNPIEHPSQPSGPALPPRSYDRETMPSRYPMQEAP